MRTWASVASRVFDEPCMTITAAPFLPGTHQPASRAPSAAGNATSAAPGMPIDAAGGTGACGTPVAYAPTVTGMTSHSTARRPTTTTSARARQRRPAS
jgi:hypothetical protein